MISMKWNPERRVKAIEAYATCYDGNGSCRWTEKVDKSLQLLLRTVKGAGYSTAFSIGSGNGINERRLAELGMHTVCVDFHSTPLVDLQRKPARMDFLVLCTRSGQT